MGQMILDVFPDSISQYGLLGCFLVTVAVATIGGLLIRLGYIMAEYK